MKRALDAVVAVLMVAGACRAPEPSGAEEIPVKVPDQWTASASTVEAAPLERWWTHFGDVTLDALVERVLARNHDLCAAASRLDLALAQARIAGASSRPAASVALDGGRRRQNFVGLPIGGNGVASSTSSSFGVSLDVSWEVDLWGRLAAGAAAAEADAHVVALQREALRLSLAGQTVKAWFALAEAHGQRELAREQAASFERTVSVLQDRYRAGRGAALDLRLAESQLEQARAACARQTEVIERVTRQIEILAGDYPAGSLAPPGDLPRPPGDPPAGLPVELIERRPDLVAALEGLRAADYRLWEARRALWPSLNLAAGVGRSGEELDDLFDADFDVWSLAAGLVQPLFQGGRLRAGVDAADARRAEAAALYAQALLAAFSEVEVALATEESLAERVRRLAEAARHAVAAEALAEERYGAGRHDILALLTARRQSSDSAALLLSARRERLEGYIDHCLALGGGFDEYADAQGAWASTREESP